MTQSALSEALKRYEPELIAIRHDIHRHPEVGFEEVRTAKLVADRLRGWGVEVTEGVAKTGVVGTLKGNRPGQRAIGLRADLDALHIREVPGREYSSQTPGKMHACGHDGHTAMLLGAARYLSEHRDFGGVVHFIFQPAEEGLGGGQLMVDEGLFDRFPVEAVYGMHNAPGLPAGAFATRPGPFLAASDSWTITLRGTGGHGGAGAHLATDPTMPLAHLILGLQTIIGRNVPAIDTAVVSVGHVAGGDPGSPNVIPSEIVLCGTARSYKPAIRDLLEKRLRELAETFATAYGCTAEVDYERRYPAAREPRRADRGLRGRGQGARRRGQGRRQCAARHRLGGLRLHAGGSPRLLHHDRQWRCAGRLLPQRPYAELRFQRRNPDARLRLLGHARPAGAGLKVPSGVGRRARSVSRACGLR